MAHAAQYLRLAPDDAQARGVLGLLHMRLDQPQLAASAFTHCLRQLEAADLLLVNKADLASEAELQASQRSA